MENNVNLNRHLNLQRLNNQKQNENQEQQVQNEANETNKPASQEEFTERGNELFDSMEYIAMRGRGSVNRSGSRNSGARNIGSGRNTDETGDASQNSPKLFAGRNISNQNRTTGPAIPEGGSVPDEAPITIDTDRELITGEDDLLTDSPFPNGPIYAAQCGLSIPKTTWMAGESKQYTDWKVTSTGQYFMGFYLENGYVFEVWDERIDHEKTLLGSLLSSISEYSENKTEYKCVAKWDSSTGEFVEAKDGHKAGKSEYNFSSNDSLVDWIKEKVVEIGCNIPDDETLKNIALGAVGGVAIAGVTIATGGIPALVLAGGGLVLLTGCDTKKGGTGTGNYDTTDPYDPDEEARKEADAIRADELNVREHCVYEPIDEDETEL